MTRLAILRYPDERLHTVAQPVTEVNDDIRRLAADMAQTMYAGGGIGLAATQVDVHLRVIVVDVEKKRDGLLTLINPQIIKAGGRSDFEEGCLSVPGIHEKVKRAGWIRVRALDLNGKPFELSADGWLAVCIQHEIDHLQGLVFVEYLSLAQQVRINQTLAAPRTRHFSQDKKNGLAGQRNAKSHR